MAQRMVLGAAFATAPGRDAGAGPCRSNGRSPHPTGLPTPSLADQGSGHAHGAAGPAEVNSSRLASSDPKSIRPCRCRSVGLCLRPTASPKYRSRPSLSAHLRISVLKGERILRSGGREITVGCHDAELFRAALFRASDGQASITRGRRACPFDRPGFLTGDHHSERGAPVETPSGAKAGRQGAVQPQRSDRNTAAKSRSQRIPGRTVQIDSFSPSPIPATLDGLVDRSTKNANRFAEFRTMTHNNPCDWPKSGDQRRSVEGLCVEAASGHRVTDV